jgi:ubiquinone/menaquinone biosynthesis C-methylase UbiE
VKQFPDGEKFIEALRKAGYQNIERRTLTFGIASIYLGSKN